MKCVIPTMKTEAFIKTYFGFEWIIDFCQKWIIQVKELQVKYMYYVNFYYISKFV